MADFSYIESTGTVLPDTDDLLTTVQGEFRNALGDQLSLDPATPQGRLIATEVDARDTFLRNMAALANQINPNLAGGAFLDAIWALTGGQRIAATRSVVPAVQLNGVPGTLIPAGTQAQTAAGALFESLSDVTLDGTGAAAVDFRALEYGPVPAAIGALNVVVSGVLGWETVTNPAAAVLGRDQESDLSSRQRRRVTLALQGVALPEAIISGLYDTEGVKSLAFRENVTDSTQIIDGITLVEHSIWACVDGGADADVAAALLAKKSLGANWNGGVTVNVTDPASGQVYPVKFDRPTPVPIKARATVRATGVVADPAAVVRAAMVAYAAGEIDGERGFVVGQAASPFELAGAVNITTPGVYVQNMEIATLAGTVAPAEVPIALDEIATLNANNIEVVLL